MFRRIGRRWAGLLTAVLVCNVSAQDVCVACHGAGGNSPNPALPSIAAQPQRFIENQLVLIREGLRPSPQMLPIVKDMKDAEIVRLAAHFSAQKAKPMETGASEPALAKAGMARASALRCGVCHRPDFSGQNQVPRLAGQREAYLAAEMRAYRDNKRPAGDTIMAAALYGVPDRDLDAMAHYLARLP